MLITGGHNSEGELNSVEMYLPSSAGLSCRLPQIMNRRNVHSQESDIICGGSINTCNRWNSDTGLWEDLLTLEIERMGHVSWAPDLELGIYLIGGYGDASKRSTTLIKPDWTQEPGFNLIYDTE